MHRVGLEEQGCVEGYPRARSSVRRSPTRKGARRRWSIIANRLTSRGISRIVSQRARSLRWRS